MRKFRIVLGWIISAAGIIYFFGVGIYQVTSYGYRWTMYDGPWMPILLACLVVGRILLPSDYYIWENSDKGGDKL